MQTILYYLFCALAVGGALGVLLSRNYINAAMSMLLSILGMSGMLFMMQAFFLAFIMLIVYAGAVMVMFVFIVMLIGEQLDDGGIWARLWLLGLWVLLCLAMSAFWISLPEDFQVLSGAGEILANSKNYGLSMFSKFLPMFEVAGLVLLVAMVGIVAISKDKSPKRPRREMID